MNKTRAMLDALMGPGRDTLIKDKGASKEKFKDKSVCKSFLVGLCPCDKEMLGGKRKFQACEKLHSELMKDQFKAHPQTDVYREEYEKLCLQELEYAVRECESHIAAERQRIREDLRRRKPALPGIVNDKLAIMKRESSAMIQRAETLDDDQLREKEALITKAAELMKERDELQALETKNAIEAIIPEEVCEVCGVSYVGRDGDAAHKAFRIHDAYKRIRARIKEMRPKLDEREQKRRAQKDEESKKSRKEEWDRLQENGGSKDKDKADEKGRSSGKESSKDGDRSREKDRGKEREGGAKEKERGKEKEAGKEKERSRDRDRRDIRQSSGRSQSRRRQSQSRPGSSRDRSRTRGRKKA